MKDRDVTTQMIDMMKRLDSMTYNHSVRVMMISAEIEEYLRMTDHQLMYAALFHDVGKIYTPFNILDKNERLTKLERQIIDLHPYIGYSMLSELGIDEDICRIILYHHGTQPLTIQDVGHYDKDSVYEKALILHTIDAFEALTSDRPYHRGVISKEALKIMMRGEKYDKKVLEYIMEISSKEEMGESAIHRMYQKESNRIDFVKDLIREMEL